MPYKTPNGPIYDSGEFEAAMDKALALSDWKGFGKRRAVSRRNGRLRGIGMCCFLEVAGGILNEKADLRFADGKAAIRLGVQAMGQGHLSTLPRIVARQLGIDVNAVTLIEGDSDEVPDGTPSVASRSLMMAGSASVIAATARSTRAAHRVADLRGRGGRHRVFRRVYRVAGTDLKMPILALAQRARLRTCRTT